MGFNGLMGFNWGLIGVVYWGSMRLNGLKWGLMVV
jgi:hypothetical protein